MTAEVQLAKADKSDKRTIAVIAPGDDRPYPDYSDGWRRTFVAICLEDNSATEVYVINGSGDIKQDIDSLKSTGQSAFSKHIKRLETGESVDLKLVTPSRLAARLIITQWLEIAPRKFSKD